MKIYSNNNYCCKRLYNMGALLFPGQGSQIVGMGLEFYNNFKIVKDIFNQADQKLDFPISKIILEGPEEELQLTKNTQPAILTVSYSIFKVLQNEFKYDFQKFNYFAGHSLGEYSALVCSNSLDFEDALYLLYERGKSMQNAVPVGKGSMLAILGTKIEEVQDMIKTFQRENRICEIANDNAEGQVIVSGDKEAVISLQKILKQNKIKCIPLKVSAPFHCSLMKPAAENMKEKILKTNFKKPIFDIINNVTAKKEEDPENIKKLLIDQIFSTVKWRESILNISKSGVKNYVELGPGKVLTGMVKELLKTLIAFQLTQLLILKSY